MIRQTIITVLLCSFATVSSADTYAPAKSGALSVSFFNLSPYTWNLTGYGGMPNPYAATDLARTCGWTGCQSSWTPKTTAPPSFFNYWPFDTPPGNNCNLSNPDQYPWVTESYIFYDHDQTDPLALQTTDRTLGLSENTLVKQETIQWLLIDSSRAPPEKLNKPAVADSWWLSPTDGPSGSDAGIVFGSLASSANMFYNYSGTYYVSPYTYYMYDSDYPRCVARQGAYPNYAINPLAPEDRNFTKSSQTGNKTWDNLYNNVGAGIVNADFAVNLNSRDAMESGGIWYGAESHNPGYYAGYALNPAMLPINLSTYTQTNALIKKSQFYEILSDWDYWYSPFYGSHYTLAIGDPFLVSSFAAKILWYLATSNSFAIQNETLSPAGLEDLLATVAPDGATGVFYAGSDPSLYAKWLLGSPRDARNALQGVIQAAQEGNISEKTIWGKIVEQTLRIGLAYAVPVLSGTWKDSTKKNSRTGFVGVGNYFAQKLVNSATKTHCQSGVCKPFTVQVAAPQSDMAQPSYNGTYSATGLLGNLLADMILQAEINNKLSADPADGGFGQPAANSDKFALFSNQPISYDPGRCDTDTIGVVNNFISGTCYKSDSSGFDTSQPVKNGDANSPSDYTNVLSTYLPSQNDAITKINWWSAVLNGAQITTEEDPTSDHNGYMKLANPGTAAFSPPTQIVDLPVQNGQSVPKPIQKVNVAFVQETGLLTVSSYTVNSGLDINPNNNHEYILVESPGISWTVADYDAKTAAPSGYHLATISSASENDFVKSLVNASAANGEEYWLGGYRNLLGVWYWENDEGSIVYTNWASGEPSGDGSYLAMWTDDNRYSKPSGEWNDEGGCIDCIAGYVLESDSAKTTPPPSGTPDLSLDVGTEPQTGYGIDFAIPLDSGYTYNSSTGKMTVSEYQGTDSTLQGAWHTYSFNNGPQTIDMTLCQEDSDVVLQLDANPGQTTAYGANGNLYCIRTVTVEGSQPAPTGMPTLVTVVTSETDSAATIHGPLDPSYDSMTGILSVGQYTYGDDNPANFENGLQTIDMTQCGQDSYVTVTISPISTNGKHAYGFLTCQSPPSLPYGACTGDPWATGGVIVAITGAPDMNGDGATFELACACVPDYLGGPEAYMLGGVQVGATSEGLNPNSAAFPDDPGPGRTCN